MPRLQSVHGAVFSFGLGGNGENCRGKGGPDHRNRSRSRSAGRGTGTLLQRETLEADRTWVEAAFAFRLAVGFSNECRIEISRPDRSRSHDAANQLAAAP